MIRRWMLTLLALLALAPFLVLATHAKKGGNKPPPEPPPPANPAITYGAREEVWVMNADGSNQAIVHEEEEYYMFYPSWSDDGEHIAFSKMYMGLGGARSELWRVDVSVVDGVPVGSNATVVVDDAYVSGTAWSPTSDLIAFTALYPPWGNPGNTSRLGRELRLVPAGGGTHQIVYATEEGNYISKSKAWSPDGSRIAFYERIGSGPWNNIRVLTVATGQIASYTLPQSEGHNGFNGLDWARTDDLLVYAEQIKSVRVKGKKEWYDYVWTVRTLDLDTGVTETVPSATGRDPAWSPDDSKLALDGVRVYDFATGSTEDLATEYGRYPDWRR